MPSGPTYSLVAGVTVGPGCGSLDQELHRGTHDPNLKTPQAAAHNIHLAPKHLLRGAGNPQIGGNLAFGPYLKFLLFGKRKANLPYCFRNRKRCVTAQ